MYLNNLFGDVQFKLDDLTNEAKKIDDKNRKLFKTKQNDRFLDLERRYNKL